MDASSANKQVVIDTVLELYVSWSSSITTETHSTIIIIMYRIVTINM